MAHSRIKGFTLIELLVVIAIIAILAAILFPVFAQARAAARGASSQSNLKQLSLAVLMYVQDYDENYPEFQRWGAAGASGYPVSVGLPFSMWTYDVAPYIKNVQVFADPQAGTIKQSSGLWPFYAQYGYNYTALSPYSGAFGSTPWVGVPATLASVARPADLVLLSGKFTEEELGGLYWYGAGTYLTVGGAEPPDCSDIAPWCFSDWAVDGNYGPLLATLESGHYTGGVSMRKSGNGNFAFTDGHVKFLPPGQAAIGTTWFQGVTSGNVHITIPTSYHWETNP